MPANVLLPENTRLYLFTAGSKIMLEEDANKILKLKESDVEALKTQAIEVMEPGESVTNLRLTPDATVRCQARSQRHRQDDDDQGGLSTAIGQLWDSAAAGVDVYGAGVRHDLLVDWANTSGRARLDESLGSLWPRKADSGGRRAPSAARSAVAPVSAATYGVCESARDRRGVRWSI